MTTQPDQQGSIDPLLTKWQVHVHRVESRIQRNASYNRFFVGFFGVLATFIGYGVSQGLFESTKDGFLFFLYGSAILLAFWVLELMSFQNDLIWRYSVIYAIESQPQFGNYGLTDELDSLDTFSNGQFRFNAISRLVPLIPVPIIIAVIGLVIFEVLGQVLETGPETPILHKLLFCECR